ncbi:MAG: hypothetical protein HZB23_06570 [Deltaproteobacteria bacterium]|nr:hypothetical protein [Deltaproteobacteria bacterium]
MPRLKAVTHRPDHWEQMSEAEKALIFRQIGCVNEFRSGCSRRDLHYGAQYKPRFGLGQGKWPGVSFFFQALIKRCKKKIINRNLTKFFLPPDQLP